MRTTPTYCGLLGLAIVIAAPLPAATADQKVPTFVPLYNGRDLAGWEAHNGTIESWRADGELLSTVESGTGWLRTTAQYSDFIFRTEFRIPAGGNSGIAVRVPDKGDPAHAGMEIQILDDEADKHRNLQPAQYMGGLYYQAAPTRKAARPVGQWNACEISCVGQRVKVVLNDQVVNDVLLDEYTQGLGGHRPLAERPQIGSIALQNYGVRVDFRNLEIADLTTTLESGLKYVDLVEGDGEAVPQDATILVYHTGRLAGGQRLDNSRDRSKPVRFVLADAILGWKQGIPGMKVGGRRKLIIPPRLAYGKAGRFDIIPPDATLIYDIEVKALEKTGS